jgi:hypothetical protein
MQSSNQASNQGTKALSKLPPRKPINQGKKQASYLTSMQGSKQPTNNFTKQKYKQPTKQATNQLTNRPSIHPTNQRTKGKSKFVPVLLLSTTP